MKKILTLCVVHDYPRILLGMKKRGFGEGKWNGFGGKVNHDETVEQAAKRELFEESGLEAGELEKRGVLTFVWRDKLEQLEVHVFDAKNVKGVPVESDEMRPEWFHVDNLPFHAMWPDDKHWMPLFLAGKKFSGEFLFDKDNTIIEHSLEES